MARYERTFLVPYVQDVCTLHLAKHLATEHFYSEHDKLNKLKNSTRASVKQPKLEQYVSDDRLGMGCIIIICLIGGLVGSAAGLFSGSMVMMMFSLVAGGGLAALMGYIDTSSVTEENAAIDKRNQKKQLRYKEEMDKAIAQVKPQMDAIEQQIMQLKEECDKIDELLNAAYSANVIPLRYRDIYASVFLYEWFAFSQADDLDMALNTFVLEEIKSRLDQVIENQSIIILNQRVAIANQYRAMEQQERHHQMLMSKLDSIQATAEEHSVYLSMIEANTAANAYFTAANYLKS